MWVYAAKVCYLWLWCCGVTGAVGANGECCVAADLLAWVVLEEMLVSELATRIVLSSQPAE